MITFTTIYYDIGRAVPGYMNELKGYLEALISTGIHLVIYTTETLKKGLVYTPRQGLVISTDDLPHTPPKNIEKVRYFWENEYIERGGVKDTAAFACMLACKSDALVAAINLSPFGDNYYAVISANIGKYDDVNRLKCIVPDPYTIRVRGMSYLFPKELEHPDYFKKHQGKLAGAFYIGPKTLMKELGTLMLHFMDEDINVHSRLALDEHYLEKVFTLKRDWFRVYTPVGNEIITCFNRPGKDYYTNIYLSQARVANDKRAVDEILSYINKEPSTTYTTIYYDIGRDEYYKKELKGHLEALISTGIHLVIYTTETLKKGLVYTPRQGLIITTEDLPHSPKHTEYVEQVRLFWEKEYIKTSNRPHDNAAYACMLVCKSEAVLHAIHSDPFGDSHYAVISADIRKHGDISGIPYINPPKEKIRVIAHSYLDPKELEDPNYHLRLQGKLWACLYIGPKDLMRQIAESMVSTMNTDIDVHHFLSLDEYYLEKVFAMKRDLFEVYTPATHEVISSFNNAGNNYYTNIYLSQALAANDKRAADEVLSYIRPAHQKIPHSIISYSTTFTTIYYDIGRAVPGYMNELKGYLEALISTGIHLVVYTTEELKKGLVYNPREGLIITTEDLPHSPKHTEYVKKVETFWEKEYILIRDKTHDNAVYACMLVCKSDALIAAIATNPFGDSHYAVISADIGKYCDLTGLPYIVPDMSKIRIRCSNYLDPKELEHPDYFKKIRGKISGAFYIGPKTLMKELGILMLHFMDEDINVHSRLALDEQYLEKVFAKQRDWFRIYTATGCEQISAFNIPGEKDWHTGIHLSQAVVANDIWAIHEILSYLQGTTPSSITYVSAFFNIGRKCEYESADRAFDSYFPNIKILLDTGVNMVFITTEDIKKRLQYTPRRNLIMITDMDIPYMDQVEKIRGCWKDFVLRTGTRDNGAMAETACLFAAKSEFVKRAISLDPFHSTHFAWIDAGVRKMCSLEPLLTLVSSDDRIRVMCINHTARHETDNPYFYVDKHFKIAGTFYLGGKEKILQYCALMNKIVMEEIGRGILYHDQEYMAKIYVENKHLFSPYYGDYNVILSNFNSMVDDTRVAICLGRALNVHDREEVCHILAYINYS